MKTLAEVERETILAAIAENGLLASAKLLGIGKTTLYRRLKEWGIDTRNRMYGLEPAAVLASVPQPRFLVIPTSQEEVLRADLKCPACKVKVLLP